MIIAKDDIIPRDLYSGVDFLDTLEELKTDFDIVTDRLKDTEKLFLEAGKNNKNLLEKEEKYKQVIDTLDEKNRGFIADIEEFKKQISNLEEALKQTSFRPAAEIHNFYLLPLSGYHGMGPVVAVDDSGVRVMIPI